MFCEFTGQDFAGCQYFAKAIFQRKECLGRRDVCGQLPAKFDMHALSNIHRLHGVRCLVADMRFRNIPADFLQKALIIQERIYGTKKLSKDIKAMRIEKFPFTAKICGLTAKSCFKISSSAFFFLFILLFQQDASYAVTRAEFLDALFTTGLSYKNIEKPPLPKDVPRNHRFAGTIGSSLKYGLIPAEGNFMPDEAIDGREAVRLALMMMGFGFEASLCESFASMGLEGDAIYSLAYGMKPPAPKRLIKGWTEPLDEKGRNSILSWTRSCKERVIWKKELQKDGINLMLYRQGTGLPENRAGLTGEFAGISAKRPIYIAAVIASQDEIDMTIAFAGTRNGKADLSLIARKENASAAVNGGFFAGRHPAGAVLLDGVHAGKPVKGRPAVAWAQNNGAPIFGDGSVRVGIRAKSGHVPVTRFNSPPPADEAAIYASRVTGEASGIAPDSLVIKTRDGSVIRTWEAS